KLKLLAEKTAVSPRRPAPDSDLTVPSAPAPTQAGKPDTLILTPEAAPEVLPVSGQRPPGIGWQIAGLTDVGLKRELNEDSFLMVESTTPDGIPYGLYVVADGLGGHQSGEIASQLTIEAILHHFQQHPIQSPADRFDEWLTQAAHEANRAVLARQADQPEGRKMGSTVVMALVIEGQAHIANVGDSRAYLLTHADIDQISEDHSLVERLVQIGQLTRDEARRHKNRNVLYNTIGDRPEMDVGLYQTPLQPGDRLLLCSDGLSGMVTDEEILTISQNQPDPAKACQSLVRAAKSAGGSDNITVIIVQVR
ncbi:MAG: Stp1/IreP family PP2C-type Ser/Thr phosphatase, partial [Chloroflexi bacterium]